MYGAVSLESGMHVFAPSEELMTYFEGKEDRREIFGLKIIQRRGANQ